MTELGEEPLRRRFIVEPVPESDPAPAEPAEPEPEPVP